jgi:hypothetical protein
MGSIIDARLILQQLTGEIGQCKLDVFFVLTVFAPFVQSHRDQVTDDVKLIRIDGMLPSDDGYPLK